LTAAGASLILAAPESAHCISVADIRSVLEAAGVELIDENGGGLGGRLQKRPHKKG